MLTITPTTEVWDESKEEFVVINSTKINMEHSLLSISKWESAWNKVFLAKDFITEEQEIDYIKCMTITQNVTDEQFAVLYLNHMREINNYINSNQSATFFKTRENQKGPVSREPITSELVYYWMFMYGIPIECQKWHFSRLMNLIQIFSIKNQQPKKRSRSEIMSENTKLNRERRAKFNTKG